MKLSRLMVSSALLCITAAIVGWHARTYLRQNHVLYLLNQRDVDSALALVHKLEAEDGSDLRTGFLKRKALVISGNYDAAVALPANAQLVRREPELLYWNALAQYQTGDIVGSRQSAADFLHSGERMPDSLSMKLANALAGKDVRWGKQPEVSEGGYLLVQDVEKALCCALAAKECYQERDYAGAVRLYNAALSLGFRSTAEMRDACRAAAFSGAFQKADLFLSFSTPGSAHALYKEFSSRINDPMASATLRMGLSGGLKSESRESNIHALSWVASHYATNGNRLREVEQVLTSLIAQYPEDSILKSWLADTLAAAGRRQVALELYNQVIDVAPSVAAYLKAWSHSGILTTEIRQKLKALISNMPTLDHFFFLPAVEVTYQGPSALIDFDCESPGTYTFTVVAHSSNAVNSHAVLQLRVGEALRDLHLLRGSDWNCYSTVVTLDKGSHRLEANLLHDATTSATTPSGVQVEALLVTDQRVGE